MNERTKALMKLSEEQVAGLYKQVFDGVEGELVLEDLRNRCYIKSEIPYGEEGQRSEGRRQVVLHIENQINYEPNKEEGNNQE